MDETLLENDTESQKLESYVIKILGISNVYWGMHKNIMVRINVQWEKCQKNKQNLKRDMLIKWKWTFLNKHI